MIITMDRESAETLNLPAKTQKWPITLHAQLVQTLSRQGATAIVFDMLFDEAHDDDGDKAFEAAVAASDKVVLCESIRQEKIPSPIRMGSILPI
jgi:CHASE2 domain-containing sensor protein